MEFNFNTVIESNINTKLDYDLNTVNTYGFLHWVARFKPSVSRRLKISKIKNR